MLGLTPSLLRDTPMTLNRYAKLKNLCVYCNGYVRRNSINKIKEFVLKTWKEHCCYVVKEWVIIVIYILRNLTKYSRLQKYFSVMLTDCYSTEILLYCGTYYIKFKSETKPTLSKWLILLAMNQWKNHECETVLLL